MMFSFLVGFILGLLDDGGYMLSVDATTKGRVLQAVFIYLVFFFSTMGAVYFMTQQDYVGVLGAACGGGLGVALVAYKNRKNKSTSREDKIEVECRD